MNRADVVSSTLAESVPPVALGANYFAMSITRKALMALCAPGVPMFALMMPLVVFVPPFYAERMGLGMATVGTIFTLGRLFDVVSDPFAGVIIDKARARISKLGWITLGAIPLSLAVWNIFIAHAPGDSGVLVVWLLVLYASFTVMSVGLFSWGSEVARDYHERSVVMGAIQVANLSGTVLVLIVPVVIEFLVDTEDIELLRIRSMGAAILTLLPLALLMSWLFAPRKVVSACPPLESFWMAFKAAVADPAFARLIAADLFVGLNIGIQSAIIVFFAEIVLALEGRAALIQLVTLLSSILGVALFTQLARRYEKHVTMCLAMGWVAISGLLASQLTPHSLLLALAAYAAMGLPFGAAQMLPRAIMSDVLEAVRLRSGDAQTALYFSFLSTTFKLGMGLGVGVSYWIAHVAGFDPVVARVDDSAHWVIRAMVGLLPLTAAGLVLLLMWRYPLNRARLERLRSGATQT